MTLAQVAKVAGVSESTVSRVVNNHPAIGEVTTRRVREAIEMVGYVPPNAGRRQAAHGAGGIRSGQVAIVPLGMSDRLMGASYVVETWAGIREALEERGLAMLVMPVRDLRRVPALLSPKGVDGIILEGNAPSDEAKRAFQGLPAVYVYPPYRASTGQIAWCDRVLVNDDAVGETAAEYLLSKGLRRLAFLNPIPRHSAFPRGEAFARTAREAGATVEMLISKDYTLPETMDIDPEGDRRRVGELIDRLLALDPRPEGLFIPADGLTCYAYESLYARGIRPERDLRIVSSNNDQQLMAGLLPRPATVDVRARHLGRRAVEQLLMLMANPDRPRGEEIRIPPVLVEPKTVDV